MVLVRCLSVHHFLFLHHDTKALEEISQDKLPNTKELKCLPALKKDLPSIYHTASFAMGSLLALSLKQLREVSEKVVHN